MDLKSSASVKTRNAANMKNLRTDVCLTKFYDFISFFGLCPLLVRLLKRLKKVKGLFIVESALSLSS